MRRAFSLAFEAVATRLGGRGSIEIEIEVGALFLLHRFRGRPAAGLSQTEADQAARVLATNLPRLLRHLIVDLHGGRIFPGVHDDKGQSLTIALPLRGLPELNPE